MDITDNFNGILTAIVNFVIIITGILVRPSHVDETRKRTNKDRLCRGGYRRYVLRDPREQFREQATETGFRGVVFSGDKFPGLYLKTAGCTRARPRVGVGERYGGTAKSSATQIFRRGSLYENIFKTSSARVLIISPISISAG